MSQLKSQVDMLLSNVSSAYIPKGYISEQFLPPILSAQTTGLLAKYGMSHLRVENSFKGGRGSYRRVEAIARTTTGYAIEGHGLEGIVTKEDYKNVLLPFNAEQDETMGLTTMLWLEKEKLLADTLASTSVVTQYVNLSALEQYNDYLNSDPIDDFSTARNTILDGCGMSPNVAVMDLKVYDKLRFHPQMLDALGFKQNRPGGLTSQELAVAMSVDKILLAEARYNSAKEGQADVVAAVWGKHIFFAVVPEKAQPYQVSAGYLVGYEGEKPRKVYKSDAFNPPGAKLILVEDNYDMLISNASAIYAIRGAIV